MEEHVYKFEQFALLERKKKKTEQEAVVNAYTIFQEKINKKTQEIKDIEDGDDSPKRKTLRVKIKRVEIDILQYELKIAKLRDENLKLKKDLRETK
jgi:hypothetical protein